MVSIFQRNRRLLLIGIGLSAALAGLAALMEFRNSRNQTQELLEREIAYIDEDIGLVEANLRAAVALLSTSPRFQPQETDRLLAMLRSPVANKRWLWAQRVEAADLSQFENEQRNHGDPNFRVYQLSATGAPVPVSGRNSYYPVVYDFNGSSSGPSSAIGFDLGSFSEGEALLGGAGMRVSAPIEPPAADVLGRPLLFALPVQNAPGALPRGLVIRLLAGSDFLSHPTAPNKRWVSQISDISDPKRPLPLFGATAPNDDPSQTMPVGGRNWRVSVMPEPTSGYLLAPATILTLGLMLTALLLTLSETSGTRAHARDLLRRIDKQQSDLRHSEDAYRVLFDNAGTANCQTDPRTGRILKVNERMCEMFGYTRDELLSMSLIDVTHPNDRQASVDMLQTIAAGGHDTLTLDKRYLRKDGTAFWALETTRLINDASGRPTLCTIVIQDISQRKADEQAKALLLRELAHRVRNTVQLMASLADQTAKSATTVESYRRNFQNRLRALKAAQDLLFEAEWRQVGLGELAASTLAPFQTGDQLPTIHIALPAIDLPTQHAQTLAIAFHELGSNAIQYGALSRPGGRVELVGSVEKGVPDDSGSGVLVMSWKELNGPRVAAPRRRGFGRIMLERVLAAQFSGTTQIHWPPEGMIFSARLPLTEIGSEVASIDNFAQQLSV